MADSQYNSVLRALEELHQVNRALSCPGEPIALQYEREGRRLAEMLNVGKPHNGERKS